jgi:hypothetical protein
LAPSNELSLDEIRAYLDSQPRTARPAPHVRAYREAAAVLAAIAQPRLLRPLGDAPAGAAAELLGPDLIPATGAAFGGLVTLAPDVRVATIRDLTAAGRVEAALAVNPAERGSALQAQLERYLRGAAQPLANQNLAELDATLQVAVWLADVLDAVPSVAEVEAQAGYQRLLAPFETLAGDAVFRGRHREIDRLRNYIGAVAPESALERVRGAVSRWTMPDRQPAVAISGIGGAGKSTLVARFMLEHTRLSEDRRIPFGYLDFAKASLDIGAPVELSFELLRQLDLQFPSLGLARGFASLFDYWRSGQAGGEPREQPDQALSVLADILGILGRDLGPRPYVIVLDTFEEVQYRGEERAFPFWQVLSDLQERWPFLRVVVCGRAPVSSLRLGGRAPRPIELGDLDDGAATAFLEASGIDDPELQRDVMAKFGRLPLSLKLVASLAARTDGGAAALAGPRASGLATVSSADEVIQAELYGRILDRIADERVRRLAHPGLTLRRINAALILNVLNEPCGLGLDTLEEATALLEELRRETSLVSLDNDDGDLVHRADLRRVMLKLLLTAAPAVAMQIHERAASWYLLRPDRRSAVEYAYHALHLPDFAERLGPAAGVGFAASRGARSTDLLDDKDIRGSVQAAIEEFPIAAQLWLATRGLRVPESVRALASRDQQHASVSAQVEGLLPYGVSARLEAEQIFASAYESLRDYAPGFRSAARAVLGRADRGASPVFQAGARLAAQRGDDERALELIGEGLERATRDGAADLTLGLLKERAWLLRDRPAAEQADGLELLDGHARRHQDEAAQLQHLLQTMSISQIRPTGFDRGTELREVVGRITADYLWQLLPAAGRVVASVTGWSAEDESFSATADRALATQLAAVVSTRPGPFVQAAFPDPGCQRALDDVMQARNRLFHEPSSHPTSPGFLQAFLRLCQDWPYRVLYVAPPEGRRGDELTLSEEE